MVRRTILFGGETKFYAQHQDCRASGPGVTIEVGGQVIEWRRRVFVVLSSYWPQGRWKKTGRNTLWQFCHWRNTFLLPPPKLDLFCGGVADVVYGWICRIHLNSTFSSGEIGDPWRRETATTRGFTRFSYASMGLGDTTLIFADICQGIPPGICQYFCSKSIFVQSLILKCRVRHVPRFKTIKIPN